MKLNETTIISGGKDYKLKMWDLQTQTCTRTFTGHSGSVYWVIKLNQEVTSSVSRDGTIRFWDVTDKGKDQELKKLDLGQGWLYHNTIMKNGTLVTVGQNRTLNFWTDKE